MPEILKQAILKPLLKKPSLDSNDFKNYRPISNLRFISKTIEKCVAKQLIQYLDINDLGETYQSAYKRNHSTETALIRVHAGLAGGQIAPLLNCSFSFYPFELKRSRIVEHEIF